MSNNQEVSRFVAQEEERLSFVCTAVDNYMQERKEKLAIHDKKMDAYQRERLDSVDYREKNDLTLEMKDLSFHDPAKYLPIFEHPQIPYLAGIAIQDDDKKIGTQHLLFGKQSLVHQNKVVVVDWRKAEISKLYYEWDEGEEYEETIADRERTGTIAKKISYGIKERTLLSLKTDTISYQKGKDASCVPKGSSKATNATMDAKESLGDYRLTDIISLISREQFRLITGQIKGCLHLSGGAGCGKTTVALHRLSCLLYNQPKRFRPERCLVVMFNRSLCDYVRQTSTDLLGEKTMVATFHSWATKALNTVGVDVRFTAKHGRSLNSLKKSTGIYRALSEYVQTNKRSSNMSATDDLSRFYGQSQLIAKHYKSMSNKVSVLAEEGQRIFKGDNELSFDDAGIILLLEQLRGGEHKYQNALNWYDHIVIDEAQDLSACELKALFYATSDSRSMTVCADTHQKILDFVDSSGLSAFQVDMQKQGIQAGSLDVSYRSTSQIMDLANRVAGRKSAKVVNEGPDPRFHSWQTKQETLEQLKRAVFALTAKEPSSLTAIICRYKKDAQEVFRALKGIKGVRLQTNSLSFDPGILVTNVHQVKGLEFSGVILWNPSRKAYPNTEIAKNLLYVALTRASNRLALYSYERLSKLLE